MGSVGTFSLSFDSGAARARFERGVLVLLAALAFQVALDAVSQLRWLGPDLVMLGVSLGSRVAVALGASFFISSPQLLSTPWGQGLARRVRLVALVYPAIPLIPLLFSFETGEPEESALALAVALSVISRALDAIFLLVLVLATGRVLVGLKRPSNGILAATLALLVWSVLSAMSPTLDVASWLSPLTIDYEMARIYGEPASWTQRASWTLAQVLLVVSRKCVQLALLGALVRVWRAARVREEADLSDAAAGG
ncbi:MAG: hypothetical protein IT383_11855 [Deltaproteobacteria bacterium]|nr:hypothetical protein [Deltaproteobacteria bacterium]